MRYEKRHNYSRRSSLFLVACCSLVLSVGCASDHARCLAEQPAVNRSEVELKVAHHDWLTHHLVTTLAEIILGEVLGYSIARVYPASSQTWGIDVTSGLYDLDVEQWHVDPESADYSEYVSDQVTVLDAGLIGYSGRSGLYTFRNMLEESRLVDYYKFYKNSSLAKALGFPTFSDSKLQSFLGESFPVCDLDWCGTGEFAGYWAPPACRAVPHECLEILKPTPNMDEGYFEQLAKNHGLQVIFGYYGEALEDHLRNVDNKAILFFWWEPTLLQAQLDVVRISFPDHYLGCDSDDMQDPEVGTIACDVAETPLHKIMSRRMRDNAAQAYLAMSVFSMNQSIVKEMLLHHDRLAIGQQSDSSYFATACAYVDVLRDALPSCLTNPRTIQLPIVTKIETFNPETLSCENETVLQEVPATTCYETPPALVDRSQHEIRIKRQHSPSHDLASIMAEIILREYLGYKVVPVFHLHGSSGLDFWQDLISGLIDVDMESWEYQRNIPYFEEGQIHYAGLTGYSPRDGLYVTEEALEQNDMADFFRFYQNATEAARFGFVTHAESPLHQFITGDIPQPCINGSGPVDWCGSGDLRGYWATPACAETPGRCIEIVMQYPGWARAIVEQVSQNWGLEVVLAYYGPTVPQAVSYIHSEPGRFAPFFSWEPNPVLLRVHAHRVSFPDVRLGCHDSNIYHPDGDVRCDVPSISTQKVTSMRVAAMPEAKFALGALQLSIVDMNEMMARHVDGGGPLQTLSEVACEFVRNHEELVEVWAPDCMVRPPLPEDVRVNDTVFSPQLGQCAPVTCASSKILTYSSIFNAFACEECRDGEIPDESQRSCRFCDSGEQPDEAGVGCTACLPGTSAPARSGECVACAPGKYSDDAGKSACDECPLGSYTSLAGRTACTGCSGGGYADELGSTACKECAAGYYKENSTGPHQCFPCERGTFTSTLGSTGCEVCPFGTTEILGALSPDFCTCPQSTFFLQTAGGERRCLACNSYMQTCLGGEHPAEQIAGYHVSSDGASVHRCASEEACPPGPLGTCSAGSSGPGCAQCEVGKYVWNGDRCKLCGTADSIYAFISPFLVVCALWTIYQYGNEPTSRKLSTTSEFIILAGLSANILFYLSSFAGFDVVWEEPLDSLLQMMSTVTSELTGVHLSCSMSLSNVVNYILSSCVPASILLLFIMLALLKIASPTKLFNTLASGTYALYLLLLLHGLKPFRYIVHPYGGKSVLDLPEVFEGSAEHSGLVACGICVIIFYCAPFAALCMLATVKVSRSRTTAQRRWWLKTFRFLFYKFRPEVFYWGVYILVRNAFFALAPSVAPETPKIGVFMLTFITSGSMAHTSLVHPWRHFWMTIVDVVILAYILLALNLAAGWARDDESADKYLASTLVSIGGLACVGAAFIVGQLLLKHVFASQETRDRMRADSESQEEIYISKSLAFFQNPQLEVSDAFEVLALEAASPATQEVREGELAWPFSAMAQEKTSSVDITHIARSMRDPEYHLQHYYEDCMHAFPELQLYNQEAMRLKVAKAGDATSRTQLSSSSAVGGHTLAEEQQRTMGAFFALYCLCRLDMNGKEVMSFGVDANRPHLVNGVQHGLKQEDLKLSPWGKMTPLERRANFYWNFDWQLMEALLLEAGILLRDEEKGLQVDDRPEGRLVAMLSLTAFHDIMKDQALCPVVCGSDYDGHKVGESILDHDLALAYLLDRHPDILPSFRMLTPEQGRLVRFTQADMGFNAGWLVQAEGPPSGVLHKLKNTISRRGVQDKDVAFYFVHWVTDLAGAEPTPFAGSEKFAAKFPPAVLQGLLGCFSIVRMLADHTETEVYEAYLRQRWQLAQSRDTSMRDLPEGKDGIARMRLLCMAQAGANAVLDAFDRLSQVDRNTLVQELSETGMPGQHFSGCKDGAGAGTPFLLYYGPAWCQRVGQQQPTLALRVLAEVFRRGREEFPESQDSDHDIKAGIMCRTIEVGLLKTADMEKWKEHNGNSHSLEPHGAFMLLVERSSNLEGTLHEAYCM